MVATGDSSDVPLDYFPCALVVTDVRGTLLYSNDYFDSDCGYNLDRWLGQHISCLLTRAGSVMLESYVMPLLLHHGRCEEIQLAIVDAAGGKIPVVISAALHGDTEKVIYWSGHRAVGRDRLYQELLDARRVLEDKATELEAISRTDELSGLFNRRELRRRADIIMQSAERSPRPLSLLVFDIDDFKTINDDHGHLTGDAIIQEIGRLLRPQARQSDVVARFGGDEFVLLLPDTDGEQALRVCERLRALFDEIAVDGVGCTVSMGVVTAPFDSKLSFEELFRAADMSLYRAKESGRGHTQAVCLEGDDTG